MKGEERARQTDKQTDRETERGKIERGERDRAGRR